MKNLKVLVITGGSEGLGAAIAQQFASTKIKIWLLSRNVENLKKVTKSLNSKACDADFVNCDITSEAAIKKAIQHIISINGKIDVLINNAGVWTQGDIQNYSTKGIKKVYNINVIGLMKITSEVIPFMMKKGQGQIVNIISTSAIESHPDWSVYVSSKFAVRGFTESLKKNLAGKGIKVIGIYPDGIGTAFYKNAGINFNENEDWMISKKDVAKIIKFIINCPKDVVIDHIEIRKFFS